MSGSFLKPIFGNCNECNKVHYADKKFLKKHYKQKHDTQELLQKADSIGIINDLTKFHPIHIVIEKLADFASREE